MLTLPCPTTAELVAFVRGDVSDAIESHLSECSACLELFERLSDEECGAVGDLSHLFDPMSLVKSDDSTPRSIGVYRILEVIGQGGMGVVYKAVHTKLDKQFAIKLICSSNPHFQARFDREKRILGRLQHPNIVAVTDAGTFGGMPYFVSELLTGRNLHDLLVERGQFPLEQVVDIMTQAATGLAYLHRQGVVHRDIKPENIFLTDDRTVKILDVGLAKLINDTDDGMTMTGMCIGTPDYISPDQIKDMKKAGHRSDIYSFGFMSFFLLTGSPPYFDATLNEKLDAHLAPTEIPDVRTIRLDVPAALAMLVSDMAAKNPARRPTNFDEILKRLENIDLPGKAEATPTVTVRYKPVFAVAAALLFPFMAFFWFARPIKPDSSNASEQQMTNFQAEQLPDTKTTDAPADPLRSPEPKTVEPEPLDVAEKPTLPKQPKQWNPKVIRPSETITLIPSGHFDDDEEDE